MLGTGGMGVVYEAEQQSPRRSVALKVMRPVQALDENQVRMFRREIETLGRLKHPGIATIYESGRTEEGQDFIAMEMVQGETLDAWRARRPGPADASELRLRLKLFRGLCDAVNYAHLRGVIHRDLKPANIIVVEEQGSQSGPFPRVPTIKILDLGLARLADPEGFGASLRTEFGAVVGTLQYMSPEQTRGDPDAIDLRTDVYSLGVMLYELMLNRRPYDVGKAAVTVAIRMICEQPPLKWDDSWTDSPQPDEDVWTILGKALEKEPDRRYDSAAALGEDIDRYLTSQPIVARPPSRAYRARMFVRRYRTGVAFAATLFVLLTAFGIAMTVQSRRIAREAEISNGVAEFLKSTFQIWDPKTARGRTFTAKEVLDHAAKKMDAGGVKDPRIQASLMDTLGDVYQSAGLPASAQPQFERALEIQRRVLGPEHPDTLTSMGGLALAIYSQGRYAEAEKLLRETVRLRSLVLGPEHPRTLESTDQLSWAILRQGRYPEAEKLSQESLRLKRRVLGPDHPDTLYSMNALASAFYFQRRYAEAEKLYRETFETKRRVLGPDHPETLGRMNNLAMVLKDMGRLAEAEGLYREALELQRRVLGREHPETLQVMNNLAMAIQAQNRLAEAESLYRETIELERRVLGPEHPKTLATMHSLAVDVYVQGRYAEAEELFRETLQLQRRVMGPEHPETLLSMSGLADAMQVLGRYAEAEELHRETLELQRRILGPDHPYTLESMGALAATINAEGRHAEAEKVAREAYEAQRRLHGPDHPLTLSSMYTLACVAAVQGHSEQALTWLEALSRSPNASTFRETDPRKDPDLKSLLGNPQFEALVSKIHRAPSQPPPGRTPSS